MDKKQIIEFREKFCFKNFDGKKHYFSLRTNIDQTKEIEQWLSNKLDEVEEQNHDKIKKLAKGTWYGERFVDDPGSGIYNMAIIDALRELKNNK